MDGHLWLIGMMGVGKSSAAKRIARHLDLPYVDLDDTIIAREGGPIAQIWEQRGEAAFREIEAVVLTEAASGPLAVIATGGGVVLDRGNIAAMRASGLVVWLTGSVGSLLKRVGSGTTRPLLADEDAEARLTEILDERRDRYEAAADFQVDTDDLTTKEVARRIEAWWNES